ncbi:MAG: hypothetical protein RSF81_04225 [Oscillospiraceae bacterium]
MKKLLSTVMAASMIASMATVSFAADTTTIKVDNTSKLYKETDGILYEVTGDVALIPEEKIYVELLTDNEGETISSRLAGQYKVVADWQNGKDAFDKAVIENKKVSEITGKFKLNKGQTAPYNLLPTYNTQAELQAAVDAVRVHAPTCTIEGCNEPTHIVELIDPAKKEAMAKYSAENITDYKYVAAIYTKSSFTSKQVDLIGSLKAVKKTTSNSSAATSKNIYATVGHNVANASGDVHDVENSAPVVNFSDVDGEIELTFGNTASFTVNAKNQNDLYLGYSVKPNTDLIDQNPEANIDFISFKTSPTFNRIGTFRFFGNEDMFVYEITEKGLKQITTKYDEDYDAYAFNTRALTSFAISDKELKFTSSDTTEEPKPEVESPSVPNKPNPETGVGNGAGVASVLAILSLVAAGAVISKKIR